MDGESKKSPSPKRQKLDQHAKKLESSPIRTLHDGAHTTVTSPVRNTSLSSPKKPVTTTATAATTTTTAAAAVAAAAAKAPQKETETPKAAAPTVKPAASTTTAKAAVEQAKKQESEKNPSPFVFGGFASYSSSNAFSAFTSVSNSSSALSGGGSGFSSFTGGFGKTASSSMNGDTKDTETDAETNDDDCNETGNGFGSACADFHEQVANAVVPGHQSSGVTLTQLSDAEMANGEENEEMVVEKRGKLFKLSDTQTYVEVGIGPFRVLKSKSKSSHARVVMRRESYVKGPGTKLILNLRLTACIAAVLKEKCVVMTFMEPDDDEAATQEEKDQQEQESESEQQDQDQEDEDEASQVTAKLRPATYLVRFADADEASDVLKVVTKFLSKK